MYYARDLKPSSLSSGLEDEEQLPHGSRVAVERVCVRVEVLELQLVAAADDLVRGEGRWREDDGREREAEQQERGPKFCLLNRRPS